MKHIKLFESYKKITLDDLTNNLTSINTNLIVSLLDKYDIEYKEEYKKAIYSNKRRSEELYKKTKIKGLVGNWKYPFNESPHLNEFLTMSLICFIKNRICDENEMIRLYNIYTNINPIIKSIPCNDILDYYDIIMGMTSGFNYDDIYDYVVVGNGAERSGSYRNKKNKAEYLLNGFMYYVPSEKTLDTIIKHFKK